MLPDSVVGPLSTAGFGSIPKGQDDSLGIMPIESKIQKFNKSASDGIFVHKSCTLWRNPEELFQEPLNT